MLRKFYSIIAHQGLIMSIKQNFYGGGPFLKREKDMPNIAYPSLDGARGGRTLTALRPVDFKYMH